MRIKIKPVDGSWRVILPTGTPNWLAVARIPYRSYEDALSAAHRWVILLGQEMQPASKEN